MHCGVAHFFSLPMAKFLEIYLQMSDMGVNCCGFHCNVTFFRHKLCKNINLENLGKQNLKPSFLIMCVSIVIFTNIHMQKR